MRGDETYTYFIDMHCQTKHLMGPVDLFLSQLIVGLPLSTHMQDLERQDGYSINELNVTSKN